MRINKNQIAEIESLIIEGEVSMHSSREIKRKFIEEVKERLTEFCVENNEQVPAWVVVTNPSRYIKDNQKTEQERQSFYSNLLPLFVNMLKELRSTYYLRMQLEESQKQTLEAKNQTLESEKQTKEAVKANKKTTTALWLSGIAIIVSIFALLVSTSTRTIKFDEYQYQEIKAAVSCDSIR